MSKDSIEEVKFWRLEIKSDVNIENEVGVDNRISTTKYSLLSWLPVSIMSQFRRVANIYFLLISSLMMIGWFAPDVYESPLDPFSTVIPLCFVLLVTSIKEGFEDLERSRNDKAENNRTVTIVDFDEHGKYQEREILTMDIKAGNIIKLEAGTMPMQVPVDMVLVLTSNYDDGNQCYIETANIDGETNLKVREAPASIKSLIDADGTTNMLEFFQGTVDAEPPNKDIHNFVGSLSLDALPEAVPLSVDNILLRSSLFTNTEWAYGIAVYTGQDTKVQMNSRMATSKLSTIEKLANWALCLILLTNVAVVSSAVAGVYLLGYDDQEFYAYIFPDGKSDSVLPLFLEMWIIFFILFNNMVPISLYITLELINVGQAWLISSDIDLYDKTLNTPCIVRSSNKCQDLGMVSNVFSDKTGTLTRNEMRFVKFVIDGKMYPVLATEGEDSKRFAGVLGGAKPVQVSRDNALVTALKTPQGQKSKEMEFLRCLATCHTVVRESTGNYRAESPDELALLEGLAVFKCSLLERTTSNLVVDMLGTRSEYQIIGVNAFTASRKRMSIVCRDVFSGIFYCMCKGADSAMLDLCNLTTVSRQKVDKNLLDLAMLGLRTLCIAHKKMSEAEVKRWLAQYKEAASSMRDRNGALHRVACEVERDMKLLGITAIEDRLQDEVPEVIRDLTNAGVIVWMLTGDKEETAVQIGQSCNLVHENTVKFFLTRMNTSEAFWNKLEEIYDIISHNVLWDDKMQAFAYFDGDHPLGAEVALVLDGPSFNFFNKDDNDMVNMFLAIGQVCRSVVACRLTPLQKQMLVSMVKTHSAPRAITLSIGDGANDVSMIREADVGVGIIGKEGRQAANNADIAIGQFQHLRKLMFVHGRWNYIRTAKALLYSIHKNLVITFTLVYFSFFALLSGTSPYESYIYTGFNFALGLPIIFFGIMDRDVSEEFVLRNPTTYSTGRENVELRSRVVVGWILNSVAYAGCLCAFGYVMLKDTSLNYGLYTIGTIVYMAMVHALQLKVAFLHHQWNYINVFAMLISLIGTFTVMYMINTYPFMSPDYFGVVDNLITEEARVFFFMGCITIPMFTALFDFIIYAYKKFFEPTDEMIFREIELKQKQNDQVTKKHLKSAGIEYSDIQLVDQDTEEGKLSTPETAPIGSTLGSISNAHKAAADASTSPTSTIESTSRSQRISQGRGTSLSSIGRKQRKQSINL